MNCIDTSQMEALAVPGDRGRFGSFVRHQCVACSTTLLSSFALLGTFAGTTISGAAPELPTSPCLLSGVTRPARCGVLTVPEDPERPDGRRLAIHFAVVPASSDNVLLDPIAVLTGGPGEKAIESASFYVGRLASLLSDRDLLLVDQRGAGQSAPLECHLYSPADPAASVRDFIPLAAVARCVRDLEKTADLTRYTTPYFASDLEQVRRALGYRRLNLFAGSYGTRAAQTYVREYPESVRTAYLGSQQLVRSGSVRGMNTPSCPPIPLPAFKI